MNDIKKINSLEYWDERFHTGDWDSKLGRQQSRYFAQLAVDHLPLWFRHAVRAADLSVCDWGCAEGDGTDVLAGLFGASRVTGVDFSASAIDNARARYPAIAFTVSNWLADSQPDPMWDVVFSSNTLEHFHDPETVLPALLAHARKCVVLLLPYREFERHVEHHYTFEASNIALAPTAEYSLSHVSVIDSNRINATFWPGTQILLIYARPAFIAASGVALSDLNLNDEQVLALTSELARLREADRERDALIADLNRTVGERDVRLQRLQQEKDAGASLLATISREHASRLHALQRSTVKALVRASALGEREKKYLRENSALLGTLSETKARSDAELAERDATIARLSLDLSSARLSCEHTSRLHAQQRSTMRTLLRASALSEKRYRQKNAALLARLREAAAQHDITIAHCEATISQRDAMIAGCEATISQRDAMIAGCEATISQHDAMIAGCEATISQRDAMIAGCEAKISQHDAMIAGCEAKISQRDAMIAGCEATIAQRDATIAQCDAVIAQLSLELSTIKLTRGWKALTLLHRARRAVTRTVAPYSKGMCSILRGGTFISRCVRHASLPHVGRFLHYARRQGMRSALGRARSHIARVESFRAMQAPAQSPAHDPTTCRLDGLKTYLRDQDYQGVYVMGSCCMGWHEVFKQRPHHIAEYLMAQRYLVVCAMNPTYPEDYTEYLRQESDRLFIVNFDNRLIWSQVVELLAVESKASLFYHLVGTEPGTTPADLKKLKAMGFVICYDYIDEISRDINPGLSDMCLERHRAFMEDEEVLFVASASNLYKPVSKHRSRNLLLAPNGVRLEDWVLEDDMPIPQEIVHIVNEGKPIVGYYGNLATWMDFDCIKALSYRRPDLNIVMIGHDYDGGKGAFAQSRIAELPNVHILPAQKYHRLKFFSRFFDIGIIPFREYELTRSVSPVKMFEYMAQGLPVVATGLEECRHYASCLNADNPDDFVEKVGTALALKNDEAYLEQLRRDAEANTWEKRGAAIAAAMTAMVPRAEDKLLSLVVPTYNMEDLLARCIDSMLAPSQLARLEIIVVNDGSKDQSVSVARRLAAQYPDTIRVIDKENGGHGSCINAGIREAKGRYFKIVDADDWLDRYSLMLHMNFLARTNTDMVITNYLRVFDDGSGELVSYADRLQERAYAIEDLYSALMVDTSILSYAHMHAITYRTELLRKSEIRITEKSFYVDQEYISFPQPHISNACYQDIVLYRYYIGRPGQSVSPEVARKRAPQNLQILRNLIALLESLPAQSASRNYALNIAFHHTWFYLDNSSDTSIHRELLEWWCAQSEDYSRELDQYFHIL
ncbi:glycosyltransferase [Burkholderia plantarii]|uniref:Glycosyltransferase n=1 Tax=Burkholderia plantarii TaxID=41899 RepID=A0A0B6RV21_BURPL|nr:glycosyltransferase [Burkholderia plantarii]AJK44890.1 glycosyltransferase [Burkholderia plantarii]